jgi:hypothetical protein
VAAVEIAVAPASEAVGLAGGDGRQQDAETDHEHDDDQQRVHRRPERAELDSARLLKTTRLYALPSM